METPAIDHLNDMLTRNYDAEAGYKKAAEMIDNLALKGFCEAQVQNRYDFGHKIKDEIRRLGGEPDKGTSIKGDIHRAWMSLREAVTNDDKAIYTECIRGEKSAIEEYDEALNSTTLSPAVKDIIREQRSSIQSALTKLEAMENFA